MRVHWTIVPGVLFFSGLHFAPGAWLGFFAVILVHELGHAAVGRLTRHHIVGIDIHGFGGGCQMVGDPRPIEHALVAWGGVVAQVALFLVALPISWVLGGVLGRFGADLFYALTWDSLILAGLNLVPIAPFDGAEAWKLPALLARDKRNRR